MLQSDELNKTLDEMVNMGFSRLEAKEAMKAAYNNPDRAIEYLLNVKNNLINYFRVFLNSNSNNNNNSLRDKWVRVKEEVR